MNKKINLTLIISASAALLFLAILFKFWQDSKKINDAQIAQDIAALAKIFNKINDTCKIIGFRNDRNAIDFLNVKSFAGAQVGSMNLLYPAGWQGPYLESNLTIEGEEYEIVKTYAGYFIIPGTGVKLGNGKVIDKSLKLSSKSDIEAMMKDSKELLSNGNVMAAKIGTINDAKGKEKNEPALLFDQADIGSEGSEE